MANKYIQAYATEAAYSAASKPSPNVSLVYGTDKLYYNGDEHQLPTDYSTKYLTFVALEDGTFKCDYNYRNVYYSLDGGTTWTNYSNPNTNTPTVQSGSTIMWKSNAPIVTYGKNISFSSTGLINIEGNALSLIYGDDFIGKTTISTAKNREDFKGAFGALKIVSAENLILLAANTSGCYQDAFAGCTTMTTPPKLPATELGGACYGNMFAGCTSLTTAPQLPATTMTQQCYWRMFYNCTSLTTAPALPATTLANTCYQYMFSGCTSLTTAPELPATTLVSSCYSHMFHGCTSLNSVTCLASSGITVYTTGSWLDGVAATGTFTKKAGVTWTSGVDGIPNGWTVVEV